MNARTRHHLYIDESGTHDMKHVDPNWPVFVLVGLLVGETYYAKTLVPRVKQLKRCHALPLDAVLHSRDIRRWEGPFGFLKDPVRRQAFYEDLNVLYGSLRGCTSSLSAKLVWRAATSSPPIPTMSRSVNC